jgi:hypothetical protein
VGKVHEATPGTYQAREQAEDDVDAHDRDYRPAYDSNNLDDQSRQKLNEIGEKQLNN